MDGTSSDYGFARLAHSHPQPRPPQRREGPAQSRRSHGHLVCVLSEQVPNHPEDPRMNQRNSRYVLRLCRLYMSSRSSQRRASEYGRPCSISSPPSREIGTTHAIAYSPDDISLATGSHDRRIVVRRLNGRHEDKVQICHEDHVRVVAFSPDGTLIVSGTRDQSASTVKGSR
jgi:WD40 repeat protein